MFSLFAFLSCSADFIGQLQKTQIYYIHNSNQEPFLIKDCFFEFDQQNEGAWGGYICIDYNEGNTCDLTIQTTTLYKAKGAKGGAIYLRNVNSIFNYVCVNNAQIFPDVQDVGAFLYQVPSEKDSTKIGSLQMTQTSIVETGSQNHDQPFYTSTVPATIEALNMSNDHSSSTLLYSQGQLSVSYSSFSHNDNPNQVIQCEGILNVDHCTFYKNTIAILVKTAESIIKESYFFDNSNLNIILDKQATIESCVFDSLKIQGHYNSVGSQTELGSGTVPSNFNEKMMATELCPNDAFIIPEPEPEPEDSSSSSEIEEEPEPEPEPETSVSSSTEKEEEPEPEPEDPSSSSEKEEEPAPEIPSSSSEKEEEPDPEPEVPVSSSTEEPDPIILPSSSEIEEPSSSSEKEEIIEPVESSTELSSSSNSDEKQSDDNTNPSQETSNDNADHANGDNNKVDVNNGNDNLPIIIGASAAAVALLIIIIIIIVVVIKRKNHVRVMEDTSDTAINNKDDGKNEKQDDENEESQDTSYSNSESESESEDPNHFTQYSTNQGENID